MCHVFICLCYAGSLRKPFNWHCALRKKKSSTVWKVECHGQTSSSSSTLVLLSYTCQMHSEGYIGCIMHTFVHLEGTSCIPPLVLSYPLPGISCTDGPISDCRKMRLDAPAAPFSSQFGFGARDGRHVLSHVSQPNSFLSNDARVRLVT